MIETLNASDSLKQNVLVKGYQSRRADSPCVYLVLREDVRLRDHTGTDRARGRALPLATSPITA